MIASLSSGPTRAPSSRVVASVLLACCLVGAALRFTGLTRESFWIDEGYLLGVVDHASVWDVVHDASTDVHPPLSYVLLWAWMHVFGDSDAAIRSLSALFATASIPAAWLLARRLVAPRAALVATTMVALSTLLVSHAHDAKQYSLVLLLATLSTERFLAFAQGRSNRPMIAWAILTILLAYTHVVGATTILAQDALLWLGWVPRASRGRRELLRPWAVGHVVVAAAVAPWVHFLVAAIPGFQGFPDSQRPRALWKALVGIAGSARGMFSLFVPAAVGVALRLRRGRSFPGGLRAALVLGTIPLVLPWIVSALTSPSFASRLMIAAVPPLAAAVGVGLVALVRSARWRLTGALALVVVALVFARFHRRVQREQWREADALIAAEAGAYDRILALGAADAILLRRYAAAAGPSVVEVHAPDEVPSPTPGIRRLYVVPSVHTTNIDEWRRALLARGWREGRQSQLVMIRVLRFDS